MTILYFAWLRSQLGQGEEQFDKPDTVHTVGDLVDVLRARGGAYRDIFATDKIVKCAVNQEFAALETPIQQGDEVAFFPPVTGG